MCWLILSLTKYSSMHFDLKHPLFIYGIPLSIIAFSILLASGIILQADTNLFTGITYDLVLTAPLAYFLLIRRTSIPKITVIPFFVAGLSLATYFIPENARYHLTLLKNYLLPVVELGVLGTIIFYSISAARQFNQQQKVEHDYYKLIKQSAAKALGKGRIANIFATELGMVYYAFFSWRKAKKQENQFTIHKESGIVATMGALIFLILVETVVFHLLLMQWNAIFAWVLFGLSIYTGLQFFGHTKALTKRFVTITNKALHLKYGLFGDVEIDLNNISKFELSSKEFLEDTPHLYKMALIDGLESHNVVLYLREPVQIERAYGMKQQASTILLHVDDKAGFSEKLAKLTA